MDALCAADDDDNRQTEAEDETEPEVQPFNFNQVNDERWRCVLCLNRV